MFTCRPTHCACCRPEVSAQLHVLADGYAADRVASTVSLILDGTQVVVVDPGMVRDRSVILDPLRHHGIDVQDVTDVVLSHHHPDHTMNVALFPNARVHDHQAIYLADVWDDAEVDETGRLVSPHVRLIATPGHTPQDITTAVTTDAGLIVCTHLWWHETGPEVDPYAPDRELLREQRERVLALAPALVVPGHGAPFMVSASTPR